MTRVDLNRPMLHFVLDGSADLPAIPLVAQVNNSDVASVRASSIAHIAHRLFSSSAARVLQYQGMVRAMVEAAQRPGVPGEPLLSVEL